MAERASHQKALELQTIFEADIDSIQRRLFYDHRRSDLERILEDSFTGSFTANIFRGSPASCRGPTKDFSVLNSQQLPDRLRYAKEPELLLLVDAQWFEGRPSLPLDKFIENILDTKIRLDYQELDLETSEITTKDLPARSLASHFTSFEGRISSSPWNLLNLSCKAEGLVPPGLAKHCGLLSEACGAVEDGFIAKVRGKPAHKMVQRDAGLEGCLRFQLCGQAGFVTGWHIDHHGVTTWVTVEGNRIDEPAESVLKYWAVIVLHQLTPIDKQAVLDDFARLGTHWMPDPRWIRVFSLIRGYTLIMPPGTIHAPITLTNCLMRGGMCWDKRFFISHHLPAWIYTSKYRDIVTNEDPANQTHSVLKWLHDEVRKYPDEYRIDAFGMSEVERHFEVIKAYSTPCTCMTSACHSQCRCRKLGHECWKECSCYGKDCRNTTEPFKQRAKPPSRFQRRPKRPL